MFRFMLMECSIDWPRDESDPMGVPGGNAWGVQCHNAPNNWRLGWAGYIDGGNLGVNSFNVARNRFTFTIPAASTTDKNMLVVDLGFQKYYISYRVRNPVASEYDGGLLGALHQKVFVHQYQGTQTEQGAQAWLPTSLLAMAGPRFLNGTGDSGFSNGMVWTGPFRPYGDFSISSGWGGALRVRVVTTTATYAQVQVCRMFSRTEGTPGSKECLDDYDRDW